MLQVCFKSYQCIVYVDFYNRLKKDIVIIVVFDKLTRYFHAFVLPIRRDLLTFHEFFPGLHVRGIYRECGNASLMHKLRISTDQGTTVFSLWWIFFHMNGMTCWKNFIKIMEGHQIFLWKDYNFQKLVKFGFSTIGGSRNCERRIYWKYFWEAMFNFCVTAPKWFRVSLKVSSNLSFTSMTSLMSFLAKCKNLRKNLLSRCKLNSWNVYFIHRVLENICF